MKIISLILAMCIFACDTLFVEPEIVKVVDTVYVLLGENMWTPDKSFFSDLDVWTIKDDYADEESRLRFRVSAVYLDSIIIKSAVARVRMFEVSNITDSTYYFRPLYAEYIFAVPPLDGEWKYGMHSWVYYDTEDYYDLKMAMSYGLNVTGEK